MTTLIAKFGSILLLIGFGVLISSIAADTVAGLNLNLLAEWVTVDYLWDSNHSRALYEESGQFVVCNNIITGVKVSAAGDIFVAVPRWMSGVPSSLNVLVPNPNGGEGYVLNPWPSWEFNQINRTGSLQYAQSFIIDSQNRMWIPEVGRTNFYDANTALTTSGPAGIFVMNITDGSVLLNYYFPDSVVPYNNSFVNDIVLDEQNGYAYFSNTWASGGIIVYNINKNNSHMFVSAATERNTSYDFCVNDICYGTDGVGASPSDGIALSDDYSTLYWSVVQGQGLYSIETKFLWDFSMTNAEFQSNVVFLGYKTGCSDGLLYLNSALYYGDITHSAIALLNNVADYTAADSVAIVDSIVADTSASSLNWIDTFSLDLNSPTSFYFTSNRLNLFFSGAMDYTGNSGANMRLFQASIVATTASPSPAPNSADPLFSTYAVAAVVIAGCFAVLGVVGYFVYLRVTRSVPPSLQSQDGFDISKQNA